MSIEIILGPPGCGKTTSLLNLVDEELKKGIPPDRVAFLTFTRRAADEAITRACAKFSLAKSQFPHFRTMHSLCYRALNIQTGDVVNQAKLSAFGDWAGVQITGRWTEDGTMSGFSVGDRLMFMENLARVRMIPLRQQYDLDDDGLSWSLVEHVARAYAQYKEQNGLVDYSDMLKMFVESGVRIRLDALFGDECQDMSRLQWAVFNKLAVSAKRVVVAGDDDQAVFSWAGADAATLIDLPGSVTVLDQSWRVPRAVQALAGGIIGGIAHRRPKQWLPRLREGVKKYRGDGDLEEGAVDLVNDFDDVDCTKGNILILARNVYLLRETIMPALRRSGIIYDYNGHSSVSRGILDAIVGWERLRSGDSLPIAQVRGVYEYMSSGVGVSRGFKKLGMFADEDRVDIAGLKERGGLLRDEVWHEALDRIPSEETGYILAARQRGERLLSEPRVRVSTVHGAKGAEADHVVILKELAKRTHREMEADEESERRVAYVGVTRARERLTIVEASTQQYWPWI